MTRLATAFSRPGPRLIPFVVAGDPDLPTTEAVVLALARAGAAAIELGIPFSDPVADGPVIQAAAERARAAGTTVPKVLDLVARLRARTDVPLVLFSYFNPILRHGPERFARDAADAGADGVLTVDMPAEEADHLAPLLRRSGLHPIFLVAPTTSDARLAHIAGQASGFIYAVARTGVTGAGGGSPAQASEALVARVRGASALPVTVGFGVSTPEDVRAVSDYADAVVVGSALVRALANGAPGSTHAEVASAFVEKLTGPFPRDSVPA